MVSLQKEMGEMVIYVLDLDQPYYFIVKKTSDCQEVKEIKIRIGEPYSNFCGLFMALSKQYLLLFFF